ncbi:hypothetical protein FIBSPDRAFT_875377 [Athelia psychrophila]|uniref:Uncharacterized protein n=1 Tax=Athelia psychrophila TaxID=1759441 RepID=A0A165W8C9_9AGAM|nr:hypothetical protein FIBSPDRAFT_875377 [Fibularhizoctonia sp. CBS 109695]
MPCAEHAREPRVSSRTGKHISLPAFSRALQVGCTLSPLLGVPLPRFLPGPAAELSLSDIARHNRIERSVGLVHKPTPLNEEYTPSEINRDLLEVIQREGGFLGAEHVATGRWRTNLPRWTGYTRSLHAGEWPSPCAHSPALLHMPPWASPLALMLPETKFDAPTDASILFPGCAHESNTKLYRRGGHGAGASGSWRTLGRTGR